MSALTHRDGNIAPTSEPRSGRQMAHGVENQSQDAQQQHKSVLEHQSLKDNDKQYVSPSDAILSPASQKLSSFKQRQINKQGGKNSAARTLFARTPSSSSNGLDGIVAPEKKA